MPVGPVLHRPTAMVDRRSPARGRAMPHSQFPRRREDGATSVEYAIMASLIAAVAAAAVTQFGLAVLHLFQIVAGLFS